MAYRQYIGARYVPLYVGNWDASRNYEPLSIVTDANGNSFTSLKDVPAGTALNNRGYWVQTSSYSGSIDTLRRDVDALQTDVGGLHTDVGTLQNDVDAAEADIALINQKLGKRNFVLIADSYGVGTTAGGQTVKGWTQWFKEYSGLGDDRVKIGQAGGVGFIGNSQTDTALTLITSVANSMTEAQRDLITDIVVAMGANDFDRGQQPLELAVKAFVEYARPKFKNAVIHTACIGYNSNPANSTQRNNMSYVSNAYASNGVNSLGGNIRFCLSQNPSYMSADFLHPTQNGYAAIARTILSALTGGDTTIISYSGLNNPTPKEPNNGVTFANPITGVYERLNGGVYSMFFPWMWAQFKIGATKPTAANPFKLCDFDTPIAHGLVEQYYMARPWHAIVQYGGGNNFKYVPCTIAVSQNALWITLLGIKADGSGYEDYSGASAITINSGMYVCDVSFI